MRERDQKEEGCGVAWINIVHRVVGFAPLLSVCSCRSGVIYLFLGPSWKGGGGEGGTETRDKGDAEKNVPAFYRLFEAASKFAQDGCTCKEGVGGIGGCGWEIRTTARYRRLPRRLGRPPFFGDDASVR